MKIGSLFSGTGGLDMGVQAALGGEVVWNVEYDDAPSKILEHHWPTAPNFGDITTVDWATVERVDVLTGGFPCQDVSLAGLRRGMHAGNRSGLWSYFATAIDVLRPELVVIENVRGLLSAEATGVMESDPWDLGDGHARPTLRAHGAVLGDLADIGYDARWTGIRAADAGAPHGRFRVFVLAHPERGVGREGRIAEPGQATGGRSHGEPGRPGGAHPPANAGGSRLGEQPGGASAEEARQRSGDVAASNRGPRATTDWGPYRTAIERWEQRLGRVAPPPTKPTGKGGAQRLSSEFVEWMMGLPTGHVTAPEIGLTRNEQLKALGNGVVPQQAELALHLLANVGKENA